MIINVTMLALLLSAMGASLLAIAIVSFAPTLGGGALGIALILGVLTVRKMPTALRRELQQDFRGEIMLALATCLGLVAMAFGPELPDGARGVLGGLWLALAYWCLGMLGLKTIRSVRRTMRRN